MGALLEAACHTLFHVRVFQEQTHLDRNKNIDYFHWEKLLMRRRNEGAVWDAKDVLYLDLIYMVG